MFVQLDDLLNLTKLLKRPYTHADIPSKSTDSATTVSGDDVDHLNVVVLDRIDADGSFLVHHLLCTALQCDLHVCMVSFSQLFSHYVLIARKMGLNNILERQQKGQLMFVDAMSRLVARDMIVGAETVDEPQVPFAKPDLIYALPAGFTKPSNGDKVLKGLCDAIIGFLEQKQQTLGASTVRKRPCLIIDDLNVLLSIGLPIGELYWMLERLRYWCSKAGGCFMVFMHADDYSEESIGGGKNDPLGSLVNLLLHGSHYILQTRGFQSGQTSEVDGELHLERGSDLLDKVPQFTSQSLHYKLNPDGGLELFGKGLSRGVI